jgi:hypothetical protein
MEQEHGLISSLLEWAGRRVDGAQMAETVAEGLGGAQIPSVPFTSGSPQGDMDVSVFFYITCVVHNFDNLPIGNYIKIPATVFDRNVGLISLEQHFSS